MNFQLDATACLAYMFEQTQRRHPRSILLCFVGQFALGAGYFGDAQARRFTFSGDHFVAGAFEAQAQGVKSNGDIADTGRGKNFDSQFYVVM